MIDARLHHENVGFAESIYLPNINAPYNLLACNTFLFQLHLTAYVAERDDIIHALFPCSNKPVILDVINCMLVENAY